MVNGARRKTPVLALGLVTASLILLLTLMASLSVAQAAPAGTVAQEMGPAALSLSPQRVETGSWSPSSLPGTRSTVQSAATRYVSPTGVDTGACTHPAAPCRSIQFAVTQAGAGDSVLVAGGLYTDTNHDGRVLDVGKQVIIEGGYNPPDWTRPAPGAHPTTLDGLHSALVLYIAAGADATVRSLEVRGGSAGNGAGLYIAGGRPLLQRNRIHANTATFYGGGVYIAGGQARLENNLIYDNHATLEAGGGIHVAGGAPRLYHNTLYDNDALDRGGGLYIVAGSPVLSATIVANNAAGMGGGVYAETSSAALDYNDVWGNSGGDYGGLVSAGSHSTSTNPLFVDVGTADLRLQAGSGCVDWIPITQSLPMDYDGLVRPFRARSDIGAHEFYAGSCFARLDATMVYTSVQEAVDAAQSGDVIQVAGLCTGSGSAPVVTLNTALTLRGGYTITNWLLPDPDRYPSILDGQGQRRVVQIGTAPAIVEGLRIRNGAAVNSGAGVYLGIGNAVIRNNRIYGNVVTGGGDPNTAGAGIYQSGGAPLIENNTVHDNVIQGGNGNGAGIYAAGGGPTITANRIHDNLMNGAGSNRGAGLCTAALSGLIEKNEIFHNAATYGGGIAVTSGAPTISDNNIYSNTATARGGGVYVGTSSPILENNQVHGNRQTIVGTDSGGGGIYVNQAVNPIIRGNLIHTNSSVGLGGGMHVWLYTASMQALVERNEFYGNTADQGGGLWVRTSGKMVTVQNNLLRGNSANRGGGTALAGNDIRLDSNTIYGNQAALANGGGGIYSGSGSQTVRNLIVAGNTNGGIYAVNAVTVRYSDIWNNAGGACGGSANCAAGNGNIFSNPRLANPAAGDLHLQSGSPCINAADPANFPTLDYAGWVRPFGTGSDMGAYEYYAGTCFARLGTGGRVYDWPQDAVDVAADGDAVKVAGACQGTESRDVGGQTLVQTVYIDRPLTLRGGYTLTNWISPTAVSTLDARGEGRGIYVTGSGPVTVEGLAIQGGSATTGGGLYLAAALPATIRNVVLHDNSATDGGGLAVTGGQPHLINNTLAYNDATHGGGLYLAGGSAILSNTIVVSNSATASGGGVYAAGGAAAALAYNDMWHNAGGDYSGLAPGATDLGVDPRFAGAAARDLHLDPASPCIHAADPNTRVRYDLEGDRRPLGRGYDVGADELADYPDVSFEPDHFAGGLPGSDTVHQHELINTGMMADGYDLSYSLITGGPGTGWTIDYQTAMTLEAGVSTGVPVTIGVPADTLSGSYAIAILTATSRINPNISDAVTDTTMINWHPGVEITPRYAAHVNPGDVITYVHTLRNTGNAPDEFQLDWSSSREWTSLTPTHVLPLGPYVTTTLLLRLIVPDTMPGGLVEVTLLSALSTLPGSRASAVVSDTFTVLHKPGDRYVVPGGMDELNNCLLRTRPCATIAHATGQAVAGDTVKIAAGTYREHDIILNKNITLRGGFSANWTAWDPARYATIVDARQQGRVLEIVGSPTVEGLHLTNGKVDGSGGAVYVGAGAPALRGNWIHGNEAIWRGGAVYIALGGTVLEGNRIYDNRAGVAGAGLYNAHGSPLVWNNFVYRNTSGGKGGGLATVWGVATLWHNTFTANAAQYGGGIQVSGGTALISNTILVSNTALIAGGGVQRSGGLAEIDYNDVWANAGGNYAGVAPGSHSLSVAPLFVSLAEDDLHLQMTSPCLDRGDTTALDHDIDGQPRSVGARPDVGADEYLQTALELAPDLAALALPGDWLTYTHVLSNNGNYTDTISFDWKSSHDWLVVVPAAIAAGPGRTAPVPIRVRVPAGTPSGTIDTLIVTATSGLNLDIHDTAIDTTTVALMRGVLLEPPGMARANSNPSLPVTVNYAHRLTNTGNHSDTFSLAGVVDRAGWSVAVTPAGVSLGPGAATDIYVAVTAPALPTNVVYEAVATITATSQSDPDVFDTVTDTAILNHHPGVLLDPDHEVDGLPGQVLNFYHTLANTGNYTDTMALDYTGPIDGWFLTPNPVTLAAGDSSNVQFQLQVPNDAPCFVSLSAVLGATSAADPDVFDSAVDTVNVGAVPGSVQLGPAGESHVRSSPAHTVVVDYWHELSNGSNCEQTFALSAQASYPGFTASISPTRVTLEAGDAVTVSVQVIVPAHASVCPNNLMVDTTAVVAAGQYGQAGLTETTVVNQCPALELLPDHTQIVSEPTTIELPVHYSHQVTNTGNDTDTVRVHVSSSQGWRATVNPRQAVLAADESRAVDVVVYVPADAFDMTDVAIVTATSVVSPVVQASVVDTTVVRRPHVSLFPDLALDARAGIVVTYTHVLLNDGMVPDSYRLSFRDQLGWPVVVTPTLVSDLQPGQGVPVTVTAFVPAGIPAGTQDTTIITATSLAYPAVWGTATDVTTIPRIAGARLSPTCDLAADPGTMVVCRHSLENTGNYTETFFLTVHPEFAFAELEPTEIGPLAPGEIISPVLVTIYLPPYAESGQTEHSEVLITFGSSAGQVAAIDSVMVNYANGTRYVAPTGSDDWNNCLDLDYGPCATPQHAADQALNGDTIKISMGVYSDMHTIDGEAQVLHLNKSVAVRGGYHAGNWAQPDPLAYPTVLDAAGQGRVVTVAAAGIAPTIEGLGLTGGAAQEGGGLYIGLGAAPTLRSSTIFGNTAMQGGGVYFVGGANPVLERNQLHHNLAGEGAGLYLGSGNSVVWNNAVYTNTASSKGGGVYTIFGDPLLRNNTFYGNRAGAGGGGGVYVATGAPVLQQNILVGNTNYGLFNGAGFPLPAYNDVWGNNGGDSNIGLGPGSFSADPRLVDADAYDLHLTASSPCLDTGDPSTPLPAEDLEGNPRPLGRGRDVGAYEYKLLWAKRGPEMAEPGELVTYTLVLTNSGLSPQANVVVTDELRGNLAYGGSLAYNTGSGSYLAGNQTVSWAGPVYTSTPTLITYTARITEWLVPGVIVTNVAWLEQAASNAVTTVVGFAPGTRHVAPGGTDIANNCRVAWKPCLTAQYGVDRALDGDEVWLAGGIYTDTLGAGQVVSVTKSVALSGGHAPGTWVYNPDLYLTVLDGRGVSREVLIDGASDVTLAGLRLERGTVGVESTATSLTITRSHVYSHVGDGISQAGGNLTVLASWVTGNGGSGVQVNGAPYLLVNNILADNALHGLSAAAGAGRLIHNTLAGNTLGGAAIGGTASMTNTIVAGQPVGVRALAGSTARTHYTVWSGNTANTAGNVITSVDLNGDPAFANPATGDYHIRSESAALDAGLDTGVTTDVDMGARPQLSGPDIGADEYPLVVAKHAPSTGSPGQIITYQITIEGDESTLSVIDPLTAYLDYGGSVACSSGTCGYVPADRAVEWSGGVASSQAVVITFTARITDWLAAGTTVPNHVEGAVGSDVFATAPVYTTVGPVPGTRYVTPAGDNADNNCRVSARPCGTVQYAANQAVDGDEVRVAGGTYTPGSGAQAAVSLYTAISLTGGFAPGSWSERDPLANPTVLDAQGANYSVYIGAPVTVSVTGFEIAGAAAYGVSGYGAHVRLIGNQIVDNGLAGAWLEGGSAMLVNNVVANNDGDGLRLRWTEAHLLHTTLAGNGLSGATIDGSAALTDTIVADQPTGIRALAWSSAELVSTLWFGNGANTSGAVVSTTNLFVDPGFVSPGAGNYALRGDSPALEAGTWVGVAEDVDRDARPAGEAPDLGADQYPLRVVRRAAPDGPAPCGVVTHIVELTNLRRGPLADVSWQETLPPGTSYGGSFEYTNGAGSVDGDTLTWLGSVSPASPALLTFTAAIDAYLPDGTVITHSSSLSDPVSTFGSRPLAVTVRTLSATLAKLAPVQATIGEVVPYAIDLAVPGGHTAYQPLLVDRLPGPALIYVPGTATPPPAQVAPGGDAITWTLTTVSAPCGEPQTVAVTFGARVQDAPGNVRGVVLTNSAAVTYTEAVVGQSHHAAALRAIALVEPVPTLVKTVTPDAGLGAGDEVLVTLTIGNEGDSPLYDAVLTDWLPAGMSFVDGTPGYNWVGQEVSWTVPSLAPGASAVYNLTAVVDDNVPPGTTLTNEGGLAGSSLPGTVAAERHYAVYDEAAAHTGYPDLTVTKERGPAVLSPGLPITYTISFSNDGIVQSEDVRIVDVLPPFVTDIVSGTSRPASIVVSDEGITWTLLSPLQPGESGAIWLTGLVALDAPDEVVLANTAIVTSSTTEQNLGNNSSTVSTLVRRPALSIAKVASPSPVLPGGLLLYTLTVYNSGAGQATELIVTDVVPANTTFQSCAGGEGCDQAGGMVTWDAGQLPAGQSVQLALTVQVSAGAPYGTSIVNNTYGVSCLQGETAQGAPVGVPVGAWGDLLLEADQAAAGKRGEGVVYQHVLTNTTNAAQTIQLEPSSSLGWQVVVGPGTLSLEPGASATVWLTVTIPLDAPSGAVDTAIVTAVGSVIGSDSVTDVTSASGFTVYLPLVVRRYR